jgi:tetratricopeptide (TPR) repeat protein
MFYPKKQNRHYLLPFIIVLFLFSIPSKAQKDSLVFYKSQFEKYKDLKQTELALDYIHKAQNSAHPKEQIELICEEGDLLIEMGLMNKAEQKLKSALELSKLLNKPSLEGYVYKELGYYYWISNNHPESYKCYLHCKDIYKKLADWDKYFENINNIGIYLEMEGNYAEARKHYEEAQQYFRKTQDTIGIISTSINICNIINAVDGPEKSLDCYQKLLKEKIYNPIDLAQINFNIALNYFDLEKFNEANIYIDQAISITEKIKNDNRLIDYYAWKAEIISKLKQYENGNKYYWKSMKIAEKYDDLSFQIAIYESLITNHIKQKKLDSIEVWIVKSNQLRDTLKRRETVVHHKQIKLDNELELNEQQLFKKSHQNKILLYLVFFWHYFHFSTYFFILFL